MHPMEALQFSGVVPAQWDRGPGVRSCTSEIGHMPSLASLNRMETWDAIRARRNVRSYSDESIAPEHLDRILEAGRRAPSASNRQKWDFVLVTDSGQLQELSTVWVGASHLATAKAAIVL